MAKISEGLLCGVDVSLDTLDIAQSDGVTRRIANSAQAIKAWLSILPERSAIALEATGSYHEVLQDQAVERGHQVYLINGKQLHHYREAVGPRAKTDRHDAGLLLRYLSHERAHLRPQQPRDEAETRVWRLLKRRATLVRARAQLQLSLGGLEETEELSQLVGQQLKDAIRQLERLIHKAARGLGWTPMLRQCESIPGIGKLNAVGLVASFHRGHFERVDQFVAFLGMDVRVRDSGRYRGKRKLTKRGESELRRLLYNAAMSFARDPRYKPLYTRLRELGKSSTESYVILARKLIRIAYCLLSRGEFFDQARVKSPCLAT